jgi:hypothetical protein
MNIDRDGNCRWQSRCFSGTQGSGLEGYGAVAAGVGESDFVDARVANVDLMASKVAEGPSPDVDNLVPHSRSSQISLPPADRTAFASLDQT